MELMCSDVFERIAKEASKIAKDNKRSTIQSRDIQNAIKLIFPSELAKHAVSEGTKSVHKYTMYLGEQADKAVKEYNKYRVKSGVNSLGPILGVQANNEHLW